MKVYLLVLLIAAAVTYVTVPVVRHVALVSNALTPVRARDVHTVPIPRLGGVAMFAGFATAITLASRVPYLQASIDDSAWAVVIGAGIVCLLGVVDDLWDLDWMTKLAGQVLAAGVMAWQGVQLITFPIGGLTIGSSRLSLVSTVLVVVVAMNAVNFVDGLDGLAAGIIGIGAVAFFAYVYVLTRTTSPESYTSLAATVVAALIGVCLGFLPHNFHPATIFMGDSGSMQLGLVSAAGTIIVTGQVDPATFEGTTAVPVFLPVLLPLAVLLLPLTDMVMAVVRRTRAGHSPFHPDRMHMHHRLLAAGHSHRRAVLVMYVWAAAVSFPAAALAFLPWRQVAVGAVVAAFAALLVTADLMPGVRHVLRGGRGPGRHAAPARSDQEEP
ncbi:MULTISPECIES: MraY family glycosyltransferase [unclassified Actinomyces]|uniref:MraY family glycosyltransferase n=1 Tax=unclassified Actinomyces TaxID=2609248 RepID=UPI0020180A98|nr:MULTISPECIES: MraY family glycosyltransferase [unclassified Actinomyces]MCL3777655.1 undecaprenyl/decaprenyl-phosphate alpha-N-acetylglucosaminyl 1-phosphate transferase [Actinomyces sp. AC-20-1]MCL3789759.1 undecaprenyl/decaprenyl-phosphate alpha-N-acetylglucosaminyl 1-phosphate transferase [Actinomyces sp. 187325]MCL3791954.1 undecaprenyl/decaprenyl-phosphate alpha-N-acetylglucosaminyl 1-phosphate transferase [Actinomyces sp. 186855]MCL3794616.1 undecaprenyl/decaprenyl-phosphate alpha-N-ac